jgi:hypothetical protein
MGCGRWGAKSGWSVAVMCGMKGVLTLDEVRKNVSVKIVGSDSKIPIKKIKELFLHQIDFRERKEPHCISCPMLIFG